MFDGAVEAVDQIFFEFGHGSELNIMLEAGMLQNYKYQYSRLLVLAVHAAAFLAARLPFLEAFAVVFLALGF